ncbi:MAG TPA: hypothetical protein VFN10_19485 [Thermoanaerobaculia bacterium]|nr:hypothetical protein [Thermoanaerobaculia bacterium]
MSATDGTPPARARARWRRALPPRFRPDARVARTLADLYNLGAAETGAVALLFLSHGADVPHYFGKRWRRAWQAGYVTKLSVPVAPGLAGSVQDVYCVETGLAQAVMDAGRPLDQLPGDVAAALRARADADRERVVALLASHVPDAATNPRRLKLHSEQARRCLAGSSNLLAHATKNAGFVAPLLYAARRAGLAVLALRGDKDVLLRTSSHAGEVLRAPDSAIVIAEAAGTTAFLVETETGSSSVQKLRAKVDAWATIAETHGRAFPAAVAAAIGVAAVDRVRVVVYGPTRLLAHIEAAIAARCDARTRALFRTVRDDVVRAHFPAAVFRRNGIVPGTSERCLAFYRTLFHAPIAGVVQPSATTGRPEVRWFPLLS